jgi:hypothetical protein
VDPTERGKFVVLAGRNRERLLPAVAALPGAGIHRSSSGGAGTPNNARCCLSLTPALTSFVELPKAHGMALFADRGILGTKRYAASGNYINHMSDYCRGCRSGFDQVVGKTPAL